MSYVFADQRAAAPRHHPGLETLAEYAAGQLRAGFDLVVAAHLRGCAGCRDDVARLEAVGGGLMAGIEPAGLSDGALAAILQRLDEPTARPASGSPNLEQLLARARRRWIAPGIWIAPIDTPHDRDDRVFMLRVGAGGSAAHHAHGGAELTQVLTGALNDNGVIYQAGDMIETDGSQAHDPTAAGDEPCICLFATQGRLQPSTWLGRIAFALAGV